MGCQIAAFLESEEPEALNELRSVPEWFEQWEAHLSRFRPESELNQLNQPTGEPFRASPILWDVLQAAFRAARQSNGLVLPNLLPALETAGYDRSFQEMEAALPDWEAEPLPPVEEWALVDLDPAARTVLLPPRMRLDLGGVAKGWAAHQSAQRLARFGATMVEAGGDLAISGPYGEQQPWPVSITHPLRADEILMWILVNSGGVATSGRDYRRWQKDGIWQHHIIDPRTSQPAQTDVLTATVIAPDLMQAEMAAKTILISGSRAGLQWIEEQPQYSALLILEDGQVQTSSRFKTYQYPT